MEGREAMQRPIPGEKMDDVTERGADTSMLQALATAPGFPAVGGPQ
jgi:hypothetical protein